MVAVAYRTEADDRTPQSEGVGLSEVVLQQLFTAASSAGVVVSPQMARLLATDRRLVDLGASPSTDRQARDLCRRMVALPHLPDVLFARLAEGWSVAGGLFAELADEVGDGLVEVEAVVRDGSHPDPKP